MAYVLMCTVRRIGLAGTKLERAICGTIRLQLLKIGALVTVSLSMSMCGFALAFARLSAWSHRRDGRYAQATVRLGPVLAGIAPPVPQQEAMQLLSRFALVLHCERSHAHQIPHRFVWLGELTFAQPAQHLVLEELLSRIERAEELCDRLKQAIVDLTAETAGSNLRLSAKCL